MAQHADDLAHLVERAAALVLDLPQRRRGERRIGDLPARLGQRGELAEAALQQRVELGRDARPVGGDLELCAPLAHLVQLLRARGERDRLGAVRLDEAPDAPDHGADRGEEEQRGERRAVRRLGEAHDEEEAEDEDEADQALPSRKARPGREREQAARAG